MKSGKVRVLFNSNVIEFKPESVLLEVAGQQEELPNDFAWIFAGGNPPTAFLKKIGIGVGSRDVTLETSKAARQAGVELKRLAQRAGV